MQEDWHGSCYSGLQSVLKNPKSCPIVTTVIAIFTCFPGCRLKVWAHVLSPTSATEGRKIQFSFAKTAQTFAIEPTVKPRMEASETVPTNVNTSAYLWPGHSAAVTAIAVTSAFLFLNFLEEVRPASSQTWLVNLKTRAN